MWVLHVYVFASWFLTPAMLAEEKKPFNLNFRQHDYKLKFEWGEVVRFNKRYLKEFQGIVFKHNRTCTAANLTGIYNVDMDNELEAYRFASNEYRQFPLRLQVNYCVAVGKNLIGSSRTTTCGTFKGCPIKKGVRYVICNFVPDPSQFPPFIPSGRYKLEVQGMYRDEEVHLVAMYGEVYRPFVKK